MGGANNSLTGEPTTAVGETRVAAAAPRRAAAAEEEECPGEEGEAEYCSQKKSFLYSVEKTFDKGNFL